MADHCQSDNLKVQTIGSVGLGYLHLVCVPLAHGKEEVEGFCGDETLVFAGVELGKQLGGDLTGMKGVGVRGRDSDASVEG